MSDLIKKRDAIEVLNAVDVYGDGIGFEVLSHAIRDVSLLPAVEAIPVKWIEQYGRENWYDFGTQYNAITEMLKAWREKDGTDRQG